MFKDFNFTLNPCLIDNLIILMCIKYAEITNSGCMCIGVKDSKLNYCIANLRRDITWINRKWKKKRRLVRYYSGLRR